MRTLLLALLLVQAPVTNRTGIGVVAGRILSTGDLPAAGVRVAAVPVPESNQPATTPVLSSIGQTDGSGNYRLENVPPGRYYIMAGLVDRPMYFPGVETIAAATAVNVTATAAVSGVDFRLPRAVNLKVSGRVLGMASTPGGGVLRPTVTLLPRTPPATLPFPTASLNSDFTYEVANVPPGSYSVQLTATGNLVLKEILVITVADKDLEGVDVALVDTAAKSRQEGLEQVWSLAGRWSAVVGDQAARVLHASNFLTRSEIDAAGKVRNEVPFSPSPVWRLARLSGSAAPYFLGTTSSGVEARDATGNLLWKYPDAANPATGTNDVWPVDLDGDQTDEIVIGFNGGIGVHVVNSKGQLLWKSTSIGNVWHVSGGDVRGNGKPSVVTTSARGNVHIFSDDGTGKVDLDPGVYANMVRVGKISPNDTAATIIAGGTNSDNTSAVLTALTADGRKQWTLQLQAPGRPSIFSTYFAPGKPWLAVGMQSGVVYVVDAARGAVIATIDGLGTTPEVAWLAGEAGSDPLLIISTRTSLTAFRVIAKL